MFIKLENGILSYQDLTMQMDNLILEFRGQIDQVHGTLRMFMDIPAQTMIKAFDIRGLIGPDYRFSIPINGTIEQPEMDMSWLIFFFLRRNHVS